MVFVYSVERFQVLVAETPKEDVELQQFSLPIDTWFQIQNQSKYSPAYLRPNDQTQLTQNVDEIPNSIVKECATIVKFHANLKKELVILYTPASNLSTNGPLNKQDVRQFTLKSKQTTPQNSAKRQKIDLEQVKIDYEKKTRQISLEKFKEDQKTTSMINKEYQKMADQKRKGYTDLFDEELVAQHSNQNRTEDWEDDFM